MGRHDQYKIYAMIHDSRMITGSGVATLLAYLESFLPFKLR